MNRCQHLAPDCNDAFTARNSSSIEAKSSVDVNAIRGVAATTIVDVQAILKPLGNVKVGHQTSKHVGPKCWRYFSVPLACQPLRLASMRERGRIPLAALSRAGTPKVEALPAVNLAAIIQVGHGFPE